MHSAPYIFFLARTIPGIIRKYFISSFSLSEEMSEFYLSIMTCPSCMSSMTGYWRHQITYLVSRVLDNMFRSNVPEEMIALETMVPREYRMDQWVHVVREEFRVISDRECPVINKLLSDNIIEERNLPAYKRSHQSLVEPITG